MKILAVLLFFSACNSSGKTNTQPQGDTINTSINKAFTIELTTSMGTGYSWQPQDSLYKKNLRLDSVTVINNKSKEDGADTQIFHFTPIKKGTIEILFIRKRPWETIEKRDKEKKFTIVIE